MGDADGVDVHFDPYLAVMDSEGVEYGDEETLSRFDAEIVDWVYPEPVENSFKFVGFSKLHDGSMFAMLAVGMLTILACVIFVKREKNLPYKALDKISIVLNFVVCLVAIPFTALMATLLQIIVSGDELTYQIYLCIPALTAFAVAASVALRRKGFAKSGCFIQLVGPVLFLVLVILGVRA